MRWIGLHLPALSLESFAATLPIAVRETPLALLDGHAIAGVNEAAARLGVRPGQKRATALALAPRLVLGSDDARRDAENLSALAHAALAFTPCVTLDARGHQVLLEVEASLRCFGGLEALLERLRAALEPLGHRIDIASAPTATGAALLSRSLPLPAGEIQHCPDLSTLRQALDRLPVWHLGPAREHWDALQGMGLRSIGDLRRLPRSGLARRFGEGLLDAIDRAYGDRPDPRDWLVAPPVFASRIELFARADSAEQVLHGARVLLARLVAWLGAQHARARCWSLVMQHEPRRAETPTQSRLEIALAEPSADAAHLLSLLCERLMRVQLAAPTLELALHCADIARGAPPSGELFPAPGSEREGLVRLIERLQARLGREQVQRIELRHDHRPERACAMRPAQALPRSNSAARAPQALVTATRPVWLLPAPLPLSERAERPQLDGAPLEFLSGPERIEAGWWDGALAERDYFIAQQKDGSLVWVFRHRLPGETQGGWFLHGRFG
jgi:protein ImuB